MGLTIKDFHEVTILKHTRAMHRTHQRSGSMATQRGRLRILATSDLHMALRSFDYVSDTPSDMASLARLATLLHETRAAADAQGAAVITVDNGDSLQGSPMDEQAMRAAGRQGPHIFFRALDALGYDAAGLGNHDFNFNLARLEASLKGATVPVLCCNVRRVDGQALSVQRWTILNRDLNGHPLRIGIFSVLPPQTLLWDADHLKGRVAFDDITASARAAIAALQAEECDVIVALAHTGLGERHETAGQENALWPLSDLQGLDAIVAGHTHLHLPDPSAPAGSETARGILNGTPVVMPGAGGAHLGVIDLDLEHGPGGWRVKNAVSNLRKADREEDRALCVLTAPVHRATRRNLARIVGHSPVPLHSYFGFVAPSAALALVAAAKAHAVEMSGVVPNGLPILSSVAPARMGGRGGPQNYVDIPAGDLSLRHVYDLCVFPNRVAAVQVTGAQLADWIDMSLGIYNQITPGVSGQTLLDYSRPAHGGDIFYGITYEIDLSQPARFGADGSLTHTGPSRVRRLEHKGVPVQAGDSFVVALSSYRANGGGHVRALDAATQLPLPGMTVRNMMRNYLQASLFPRDATLPSFRFTSLGDTEVQARTGPGARPFLSDLRDHAATTDGIDRDGFLQLRLRL